MEDDSGTARDYGNMLNEYIPKKKKKKIERKNFSAWTKIKGK